MSLLPFLETRRVILCVGCGGVGKTTTAAALALAAASRGKNVLCLTIDPARRLANSLGLQAMTGDAQQVENELFVKAGVNVTGSLTVMMLDTKRTFDELITRHASSVEARERILRNRLYQYISTSLAGTHEYMAMEKLWAVRQESAFDLIILDTPPTTNALDFLDAPERLVDALDSVAMRWLMEAFHESGALSLNLVARSAALVLRGIGKITGGGFLEQVAEFVMELNDLFGGFKARARAVAASLRASDVAYVLVTTPTPMSIQEVLFFCDRLRQQGMPRNAFVVNRMHEVSGWKATPDDVNAILPQHSWMLTDDSTAVRLVCALDDEARLAAADGASLRGLNEERALCPKPLLVKIPALPYDVHDLPSLNRIASYLVKASLKTQN